MNAFDRLKEQLPINSMALDTELMELPSLVEEIGEESAKAIADMDAAKITYDLELAKASDFLRTNMISDAKGQPKLRSEAQIQSEVILVPTVTAALQSYEKAKYNVARWRALQDAYRAKRETLMKICDLTISGYLTPNAVTNRHRTDTARTRRQLNTRN